MKRIVMIIDSSGKVIKISARNGTYNKVEKIKEFALF